MLPPEHSNREVTSAHPLPGDSLGASFSIRRQQLPRLHAARFLAAPGQTIASR
jgi:hypothetical protein